jgi:hypothetical protein
MMAGDAAGRQVGSDREAPTGTSGRRSVRSGFERGLVLFDQGSEATIPAFRSFFE